jgi:actin-related protein
LFGLFQKIFRALHINSDQIYHLYISLNVFCIHTNALYAAIGQVLHDINLSSLLEIPIYLQTQFCSLVSTTQDSGLIVDIGYNETRILPMCHGKIITTALKLISIGSRHVLDQLKSSLIDNNPHLLITHTLDDPMILEDILVRICYCDQRISEEQDRLIKKVEIVAQPWPLFSQTPIPKPKPKYPPKRKLRSASLREQAPPQQTRPRSFTVTSKRKGAQLYQNLVFFCKNDVRISINSTAERTQPLEVLFRSNDEGESIVKGIMDSVRACNRDCRKLVVNNIIVCGGASMYNGFVKRLCAELWHNITSNTRDRSLRNLYDKMRFYRNNLFPSNITAWNGASIMVSKFSGSSIMSKTSSPSTPTKQQQ